MTKFENALTSFIIIVVMLVVIMLTEQSTVNRCHRAALEAGVAHEIIVTNSTLPLRVSVEFQYKTNLVQ